MSTPHHILRTMIDERTKRGWPYPVSERTFVDYTRFWVHQAYWVEKEFREAGKTFIANQVHEIIAETEDFLRTVARG